ncbi:hypothetical protein DL93DRAFT_204607 [Clavulina sp. PMI_390]|nr:hypothetical protein DL93DRAFT_204607 [Clavulina sp. PMI_390]
MASQAGVKRRVVLPDLSELPNSSLAASQTSTSSSFTPTLLYDQEFVERLQKAVEHTSELDSDILVPSSCPPSPRSEERISILSQAITRSLERGGSYAKFDLLCIRRPRDSLKASLVPKASRDDGEVSLLEDVDLETISRQLRGELPVQRRESKTKTSDHPTARSELNPNPKPPKKTKDLGAEVRATSQLPFPAIKRLTPSQNKPPSASAPPATPITPLQHSSSSPAYGHLRPIDPTSTPRPLKRMRNGATKPSAALGSNDDNPQSRDVSLHLDSSLITPPSSMNLAFDINSSLDFSPFITSTPVRQNYAIENSSTHPAPLSPHTPRRSSAFDYCAKASTPSTKSTPAELDSRTLKRVPTFDDLMKSGGSNRRKRKAVRSSQDGSAAIISSQESLSSQSNIPIPSASTLSVDHPLSTNNYDQITPTVENVVTGSQESLPPSEPPIDSLNMPEIPVSPSKSDTRPTPTVSPLKMALSAVSDDDPYELMFNSQFNVEQTVDGISRFMGVDVDDVFA